MKFLLLSVLGGFGFISSKKRSKTNSTYLPPLGLLYLGKMLIDAGHSVNILDFYTKEELKHAFNSTDAIGISVSTPFYKDAIKLTNIIKQRKIYPTL